MFRGEVKLIVLTLFCMPRSFEASSMVRGEFLMNVDRSILAFFLFVTKNSEYS